MVSPDEFPDAVILEDEIGDGYSYDDSYLDATFESISFVERSDKGVLSTFAHTVDDTQSWQFFGARGSTEKDTFVAYVMSRGSILRVSPEDFGDIASSVEVTASDDEMPSAVHTLRYEGDSAGLEFFAAILREQLDRGIEGDTDMAAEMGGSLFVLGAVLSGSRWAHDMGLA